MQLRIGHLSTAYHTSFILMGEHWIEEKIGEIETDWILFATGPQMIESFEKGQLDLGYIGLPPAMIGISRGIPLKCIAGGHVEGTMLVGASEFKSFKENDCNPAAVLRQLRNRIIACPRRGSIHDVILREYLAKAGLEGSVEVRNFEWADLIPDAILAREVHAAAGTPALAALASKFCGAKVLIPPSALWRNNPSYGIVASAKLVENYPDLLEEFIMLHEDASNLIRRSPREAARIVARVIELVDEEFVLATYQMSPKYCAALSQQFIESSMKFLPVLSRLGYIKHALREEDIFDKRLVAKVHPMAPHYDDPMNLSNTSGLPAPRS